MGRFTTQDPMEYVDGLNTYAYVKNNPVNGIDLLGLTPFTNDSDIPIPYKPEHGTDIQFCEPGDTCDVDGVYPPDGGYPIKICDGCNAEVEESGELTVTCDNWVSWLCQAFEGGQEDEDFLDEHSDWPRYDSDKPDKLY